MIEFHREVSLIKSLVIDLLVTGLKQTHFDLSVCDFKLQVKEPLANMYDVDKDMQYDEEHDEITPDLWQEA